MDPQALLPQVLFFFGLGFFAANLKVVADLLRFQLRKTSALLVWESPKPPYYGYAFPLSTRIARGFYRDGVWSDSGFMPWGQISAVSWREEGGVTLVLISHFRSIAKRLAVPGHLYGQARRVLRDKVKAHDIHIGGSGLDLGSRDDQDAV